MNHINLYTLPVAFLLCFIILYGFVPIIGVIGKGGKYNSTNLQAHCQSPESQRYKQSFVKELAKLSQ